MKRRRFPQRETGEEHIGDKCEKDVTIYRKVERWELLQAMRVLRETGDMDAFIETYAGMRVWRRIQSKVGDVYEMAYLLFDAGYPKSQKTSRYSPITKCFLCGDVVPCMFLIDGRRADHKCFSLYEKTRKMLLFLQCNEPDEENINKLLQRL